APAFELIYAHEGLQTLTLDDLKGKPSIISVVPSLDTPVCATQTKTFFDQLGSLGDKVNAVTVSRDTPFAQARFCGAENVDMRTASDYKDHAFGKAYGVEIEELGLLTRAVFVLNAGGEVVYREIVAEVTNEPDYGAALEALQGLV
ncbi:MAG: thiol peroxidase, partial [Planctomycetota bacterium]